MSKRIDNETDADTVETSQATGSLTGPRTISLTTYPISLKKINDMVYADWTDTNLDNSTSTTFFTASGAIPSGYRPTATIYIFTLVQLGASKQTGMMTINTSGDISLYATAGLGNFTSGNACGFFSGSGFWFTA